MTTLTSTKKNYTKTDTLWADSKGTDARPCVWMQARVTAKKFCNNFYDCTSCKYDSAMVQKAEAGKQMTWQDAMRLKDGSERTCRHAMTGRADFRTCPMNYNCSRCEFDQYFEETVSAGTGHKGLDMLDVRGFEMPAGFRFHQGHTWAAIDSGGIIRIGMDDFAFKVLGSPDGFAMPLIGQELNKDNPAWGIKRRDNLADVLSPVNGVITAVNTKALSSPEVPSETPYQDGWLFTVHNSDIKGVIKELMAQDESERWLNHEVDILEEMVESVTGPLATDGGYLQKDVFGNLPELGWNRLTAAFLKN